MTDRPYERRSDVAERLAAARQYMAADEALFHRTVHYAADVLWTLGAVEGTLAALYDLLEEAAGPDGLDAALRRRGTVT